MSRVHLPSTLLVSTAWAGASCAGADAASGAVTRARVRTKANVTRSFMTGSSLRDRTGLLFSGRRPLHGTHLTEIGRAGQRTVFFQLAAEVQCRGFHCDRERHAASVDIA